MKSLASMFSVKDVSFAYGPGAPDVLRELTLEISSGTITAILGPNGSGKTTLLNLLLGWLLPGKGLIELAGRAFETFSRRDTSRLVGIVPQKEGLAFDLSVFEYVLLGRAPYLGLLEMPGEEERRLARAAMETAGLPALASRSVLSLSGGERQLATLARVLAQNPEALLLDEPMSHLDIGNTRRILGLLESLREAGKTVIFTTHDPNIAAAVSDAVVLLKSGRILASGPPATVMTSANLEATYGVPVRIVEVDGRPFILTWLSP
jgi:iron complex transport system ATP-binding protein